ncbi:MAG: hypothetical protein NDJ90_05575 [Oligoflexia bacterium]|nr:hypothetical protein [Oligoflexia bacterium]
MNGSMSLLGVIVLTAFATSAQAMPHYPVPTEVARFFENTIQPSCASVGVKNDLVFNEVFYVRTGRQPSELQYVFNSIELYGERFDYEFEVTQDEGIETLTTVFHEEACFSLPFREDCRAAGVHRFEITVSKESRTNQIISVNHVELLRKKNPWNPGHLKKEWVRINPAEVCALP